MYSSKFLSVYVPLLLLSNFTPIHASKLLFYFSLGPPPLPLITHVAISLDASPTLTPWAFTKFKMTKNCSATQQINGIF